MIDPYAGPPAFAQQPSDLTEEERNSEIVLMRLFDVPGDDVAYDLGLSPVHRPCPIGGRGNKREDLLP